MSYSSKTIFDSAPSSAPEYLTPKRIKERNEKGDVYSFGVIIWELLTGQIPWEGLAYLDIIQVVSSGSRLKIPEKCDRKLKAMAEMCWKDGKDSEINIEILFRSEGKT